MPDESTGIGSEKAIYKKDDLVIVTQRHGRPVFYIGRVNRVDHAPHPLDRDETYVTCHVTALVSVHRNFWGQTVLSRPRETDLNFVLQSALKPYEDITQLLPQEKLATALSPDIAHAFRIS